MIAFCLVCTMPAYSSAIDTRSEIQQLYVGYLGRGADQAGLDYWVNDIDTGVMTMEQLRANLCYSQPEYLNTYGGLTREEQLKRIYLNIFEREPDVGGVNYWAYGGGASVNVDQLIVAFINSASPSDELVLDNKLEVAIYYTDRRGGSDYNQIEAMNAIDDVDSTAASVAAGKSFVDSLGRSITVTATAGTGGDVTFGSSTVNHGSLSYFSVSRGSSTSFSVSPNSGYAHGAVSGTCPAGSWNGSTYTIGNVLSECYVSFSFTIISSTSTSITQEAYWWLLDEQAEVAGSPYRLYNTNVDGISFEYTLNDVTTYLTISNFEAWFSGSMRTHSGFVNALQYPLLDLIASGVLPEGTTLTLDYSNTITTNTYGALFSTPIPAIVLTLHNDHGYITPTGFHLTEYAWGSYDLFFEYAASAIMVTDL